MKCDEFLTQAILLKAFGHKYLRKVPKKSGKGFWYVYKETFQKPLQALSRIFGVKSEKIDADFKEQNIERDYGADKVTYAAHVLEYFTNREKWDGIFAKEENRNKYKTPQKPKAKTEGGKKPTGKQSGSNPKTKTGGAKTNDSAIRVNRSLMYRVWATYNKGEAKEAPKQEIAPQTTSKLQTDAEMIKEQEATKKAREEAGLPPVREDIGERVSFINDVTQKGEKEDATARKETALERIREAGAKKERLHETDIDWEAIEDGSGAAKDVITKANVFGQADWEGLKKNGMTGGAAFLIDKVYETIAEAPQEDSAEARRAYVNGINSLRNRLENAQEVQDVKDVLEEIRKEKNGGFVFFDIESDPEYKEMKAKTDAAMDEWIAANGGYSRAGEGADATARNAAVLWQKVKELEGELDEWIAQKTKPTALANPISKAWQALGEKFAAVLDGNDRTFESHALDAERGEHDKWEWAEKYGVAPIKGEYESHFIRNVAPSYKRIGGRDISAKSTEEVRQLFNLRGIAYGDWVMKDLPTAQWHIRKCAEGFADLADITGIPDKLISLNGRVALGIGAADQEGTLAHYSPYLREININKMNGGGSLAHEWFHAFDNLIMDAIGSNANYNYFTTNKYYGLSKQETAALRGYLNAPEGSEEKSEYKAKCEARGVRIPEITEEHQIKVAQAFEELSKAMTEGNASQMNIKYENIDCNIAKKKIHAKAGGIGGAIYRAGDFKKATEIIFKKTKSETGRIDWLKLAAAHYYGESKRRGNVSVNMEQKTTNFFLKAKEVDIQKKRDYWATTHEMAARAFEAYVSDKLEEQGRRNDYLVRNTGSGEKFPESEERKRINAAFDKLFRVVAETNAIRKAINALNKKKRWLWIDENGQIWIKKSVADAWRQVKKELEEKDAIEKGRDFSKLHKKRIVDKNGYERDVWVSNKEETNKQDRAKAQEEGKTTPAVAAKKKGAVKGSISSGTGQTGSKATGNAGDGGQGSNIENNAAPKKGGGGKGGGGGGGKGRGGGSTKGFLFSDKNNSDEKKAELANKIVGTIVAKIKADTVSYNGDGDFRGAAKKWLANNSQGNAKTVIGDVDISWGAVKADMNHNRDEGYMKLQTLPAVKDILEKGTYLGYEYDFSNKPIDNHYFAGKIKYGSKEKIIFCRVRKNAGMDNRFYVHEVFTAEEIKAKPTEREISSLRDKPLYQFILHDVFTAANRIEKKKQKQQQAQKNKEAFKRVPGTRLARLTENPPKSTLPQDSSSVNKKPKKDVKKSAKNKKWIWIDENGQIWIRKGILEAWYQGLAGK